MRGADLPVKSAPLWRKMGRSRISIFGFERHRANRVSNNQQEAEVSNVLHIVASPRESSQSGLVAGAFSQEYLQTHRGARVDELDLWALDLPEIREDILNAKYAVLARREHTEAQARAWEVIKQEAARLLAYDTLVISTPMWNFGLPYRLKHYIDVVTQPGLTFKWTPEKGYEGLVHGRRAVVIYASSFDYAAGTPLAGFDHQKPYLDAWLRFIGITDISTITFAPTHPDAPAMGSARDAAMTRALAIAGSM
ncbi:FMN-dependent NADH-azoreductase [Cupriavidus sp. CuC1]|uniref:FMN-dependent NADH-azoreductase n=1 Tax=Cupriavidus sp. CuC1 TaxID=3373131 RepID=UPI0037D1DD2E